MKYQGNKTRIVGDILPIMLSRYDGSCFVDAFCGSCSVIQDVPSDYRRIANDKNRYLVAMWKSLVGGKTFTERIEKPFYDKVRDCFNGRFFSGGYSGHSVATKTGKPRDYITENIGNIRSQLSSHDMTGIEWYSTDYYNIPLPDKSLTVRVLKGVRL